MQNVATTIALLLSCSLLAACRPDYSLVLHSPARVLQVGDSVPLWAILYENPSGPLNTNGVYDLRNRPEAFQWSISDSTIIRVDHLGVAHAKNVGEAVIVTSTRGIVSNEVLLTVVDRRSTSKTCPHCLS